MIPARFDMVRSQASADRRPAEKSRRAEAVHRKNPRERLWIAAAVALCVALAAARKAGPAHGASETDATEETPASPRQDAAPSAPRRSEHRGRSLLPRLDRLRDDDRRERQARKVEVPPKRPDPRTLLPIKEGFVPCIAFSPDGKTLAAGYSATAARPGRRGAVGRGRAERLADDPLPVEEGDVSSVAFSPDGKTLAAGLRRRASAAAWCCGTWPRASAWRTAPLPVKEGDVVGVAFSPDGKTLAAGYARRRRRRRGAVGRGHGPSAWRTPHSP